MKLIISRNQKEQKGVFGGHKGMTFILSYRVDLEPQEKDLVARYRAEKEVLTTDNNGKTTTINDLVNGQTESLENISILLNNEEVVKKACHDFKILLDVMDSFGGNEVIEF